ncbi:hypothetical protein ACFLSX_04355 [Calditrichota bacterium]
MNFPKDFKEFIILLNKNNAEYLIVGGYAVGFHSRPKFTHDIDIWINNTKKNAGKIIQVLIDFGFTNLDITIEELSTANKIIQLGNEPMRIDLMTSVSGLDFDTSYKRKITGKYYSVNANFLCVADLLKNKSECGRKKDLFDIDWIQQYKKSE